MQPTRKSHRRPPAAATLGAAAAVLASTAGCLGYAPAANSEPARRPVAYVAYTGQDVIEPVDVHTGEHGAPIHLEGVSPSERLSASDHALAIDDAHGTVWASMSQSVVPIDETTNRAGTPVLVAPEVGTVIATAMAPATGRLWVLTDDPALVAVDAATHVTSRRFNLPLPRHWPLSANSQVVISSDGTTAVIPTTEETVFVDLATGVTRSIANPAGSFMRAAAFARRDTELYLVDNRGRVHLLDLARRAFGKVAVLPCTAPCRSTIATDPTDSTVRVTVGGSPARVYSFAVGDLVPGPTVDLGWSGDSDSLAFTADGNHALVADSANPGGGVTPVDLRAARAGRPVGVGPEAWPHSMAVTRTDVAWHPATVTVQRQGYASSADTALSIVGAIGVLSGAWEAHHLPLTAQLAVGPHHGTLSLRGDGSFDYTPEPGWTGVDTFTYRATNGSETSLFAPVQITVS